MIGLKSRIKWVAGAALLLIFAYCSYLNRNHQLDDGLIVLRYISNALAGDGLVYNPGERINGLTSAIFTYCSLVLAWVLGGNVQLASVLVSALGWMGTGLGFGLVFSRYSGLGSTAALWGVMFLVLSRFTYLTYGMETSLFMALSGLSILLFLRNNYFGLGITSACLILTRAEGLFLLTALVLEHFLLRRRNPRARDFLVPGLLMLGQFCFNLFYYGAILPQSAAAKISQGQSEIWAGLSFSKIGLALYNLIFGGWILFWPLLALAVVGFFATRSMSLNRILLCFVVLYSIFFIVLRIPGQVWYYGPYFVGLFFYGGTGVAFLTDKAVLLKLPFRVIAVTLLVAVLAVFAGRSFEILPPILGQVIREDYKQMGLWLRENTPEDAQVAAVEIGTVGYYSRRYIVDILGLVSPPNARFVAAGDFVTWTVHYHPDFILVHDPILSIEEGARLLLEKGAYRVDERFDFSGVRLLKRVAGSER